MSAHLSTELLHDVLDGDLEGEVEARAREHLNVCPECRRRLSDLEGMVGALRALPRSARPPEGLWKAVERRIGAATVARVIPLRARRRTLTLSLSQLAAAAAVVALLSAGTAWMARSPDSGTAPATGMTAQSSRVPGGAARRVATLGDEGFEATVRDLEALVEAGRGLLRPETLDALERSLATIDEAMADVREALEDDPSSPLLQRMLVKHQTAKVRVLRRAATALEARS